VSSHAAFVCFISCQPSIFRSFTWPLRNKPKSKRNTASWLGDDPTITRCIRQAERLGAGGVIVMNLFAWVATRRTEIYEVEEPVGADTDAELLNACQGASHVICGWGNDGRHQGRDRQVLELLRANGIRPKALHITKEERAGPSALFGLRSASARHPLRFATY
jgi:hypothetical protein